MIAIIWSLSDEIILVWNIERDKIRRNSIFNQLFQKYISMKFMSFGLSKLSYLLSIMTQELQFSDGMQYAYFLRILIVIYYNVWFVLPNMKNLKNGFLR